MQVLQPTPFACPVQSASPTGAASISGGGVGAVVAPPSEGGGEDEGLGDCADGTASCDGRWLGAGLGSADGLAEDGEVEGPGEGRWLGAGLGRAEGQGEGSGPLRRQGAS